MPSFDRTPNFRLPVFLFYLVLELKPVSLPLAPTPQFILSDTPNYTRAAGKLSGELAG